MFYSNSSPVTYFEVEDAMCSVVNMYAKILSSLSCIVNVSQNEPSKEENDKKEAL